MLKKIVALIVMITFVSLGNVVNAENSLNIRDNMPEYTLGGQRQPFFWIDTELGKTESEITNKYLPINKTALFYQKSTQTVNSQYKLVLINDKGELQQGIYAIDNNSGKSIAYNIFEDIKGFYDELSGLISSIKSLSLNQTFLENDIIQTENMTVSFYEKSHANGFIERYAIATNNQGNEEIIMDSYYPIELEEYIAPHIIKNINNYLDFWNRYINGEKPPIELRY